MTSNEHGLFRPGPVRPDRHVHHRYIVWDPTPNRGGAPRHAASYTVEAMPSTTGTPDSSEPEDVARTVLEPDTSFVLDMISRYSTDDRFGSMLVESNRSVHLRVTEPQGRTLASEIAAENGDVPIAVEVGGASHSELWTLVEEAQRSGFLAQPNERAGVVTVYGVTDPDSYPTQSPNLRVVKTPFPEESGEELSG